MWFWRILMRVIIKAVVLLGAMWYVIANVDNADQFIPVGIQRVVKWILVLIILGALLMVFGGAVHAIRSRREQQQRLP
jgi:cytochrome c biogenesis factor